MKKLVTAAISFVLVFTCVFVLSGWFVTPYLPSMPEITFDVRDPQFWTTNWAGVALGGLMGLVSARSVLSKKKKKKARA